MASDGAHGRRRTTTDDDGRRLCDSVKKDRATRDDGEVVEMWRMVWLRREYRVVDFGMDVEWERHGILLVICAAI